MELKLEVSATYTVVVQDDIAQRVLKREGMVFLRHDDAIAYFFNPLAQIEEGIRITDIIRVEKKLDKPTPTA